MRKNPGIRHGIRSVVTEFCNQPRLAVVFVALIAVAVARVVAGASWHGLLAVFVGLCFSIYFRAHGYDRYYAHGRGGRRLK